jgi:hypothetical protein
MSELVGTSGGREVVASGNRVTIGIMNLDESRLAEHEHTPGITSVVVGGSGESVLRSVVRVAKVHVDVRSDRVLFSDFFKFVISVFKPNTEMGGQRVNG